MKALPRWYSVNVEIVKSYVDLLASRRPVEQVVALRVPRVESGIVGRSEDPPGGNFTPVYKPAG